MNRMEALRPHLDVIRDRMDFLSRRPPQYSVGKATLAAGSLTLKLLAEGTDDFLSVLQKGSSADDPSSKLQQELAGRDLAFAGKKPKGKGSPRTYPAFYQRISSWPTEAALELANCPGHPLFGAGGFPFIHLLAFLRQRELLSTGKECSIDEIVRWGGKWEDKQRVVGWHLLEPGVESCPARVFVMEKQGATVYHWLGLREEATLREGVRRAGEFAAEPSLDGMEQNEEVDPELVPVFRQKVEARDVEHVIVADFGLSPLKQADVNEIVGDRPFGLKLVDVLDI